MDDAGDIARHLARHDFRKLVVALDSNHHHQIVFAGDGIDFRDPVDLHEAIDDLTQHRSFDVYQNNSCYHHVPFQ